MKYYFNKEKGMKNENTLTASACTAEEQLLLNELAIDDFARAKQVDADTVAQLKNICGEIARGEVSETAIRTILAGVTHDDDVRNADGEGYLRGRNEKIEIENRFDSNAESRAERNSVMPRFARRSIWDIAD